LILKIIEDDHGEFQFFSVGGASDDDYDFFSSKPLSLDTIF